MHCITTSYAEYWIELKINFRARIESSWMGQLYLSLICAVMSCLLLRAVENFVALILWSVPATVVTVSLKLFLTIIFIFNNNIISTVISRYMLPLSYLFQEHTGRVFRLQFDEFQIVSSSHDDTILIWDFLNVPLSAQPDSSSADSPTRTYTYISHWCTVSSVA